MGIRKTEDHVRYCLFESNSDAIELVRSSMNGVYGSGPKFTGIFSEIYNWMISLGFGQERYNYSSVIKNSYGRYDEESGLYDEESCLYSMQVNESDCAILYARVVGDGLRHQTPYIADYITMLSKYNLSDSTESVELLHSFRTAFDRWIWLTVFLLSIIFILHYLSRSK